jgi:hypothetical protein
MRAHTNRHGSISEVSAIESDLKAFEPNEVLDSFREAVEGVFNSRRVNKEER